MSNKKTITKVLIITFLFIISLASTNWIVYGGEISLYLRFLSPWDTPEPQPQPQPQPQPNTPTPEIPIVIALKDINIRSGPGVEYDKVGYMLINDQAIIIGTSAVNWWKIECPINASGYECWVTGDPSYSILKNTESVIWVQAPPTPTPVPPTLTPVLPTLTPVPPTITPVPPTNTPVPPTVALTAISTPSPSGLDSSTNESAIRETATSISLPTAEAVTPTPGTQLPATQSTTPRIFYFSVALIATSFLVLGVAIGLFFRRKS